MLNNQTKSVYDCVKSLSQRAIKEISLELREVSILMSKLSVNLLQWHLFSMQWSIRSHRSTHQWIWSYIHVQLVSLLQWRAQSQSLQWASRSVSLLQWHHQSDDLLIFIALSINESIRQFNHVQIVSLLQRYLSSTRWSIYSHRSTHQWIWSNIHVQLVSLLQWHLSSMQWLIYSHHFIYQWIDLSTRSRATSESATMTFSMQWFTRSHHSIHQWIWSNVHVQLVSLLQWHHSISHSESVTIDISILHKTKKIHSCKHESLKRRSNVTILATHLCW